MSNKVPVRRRRTMPSPRCFLCSRSSFVSRIVCVTYTLLLAMMMATSRMDVVVNAVIGSDGSCSILTLLPFTDRGSPSPDLPASIPFGHMAATFLAMDHFNNRDSSVVPELANPEFYRSECNVYFPATTLTVADDGNFPSQAVSAVLDAASNSWGGDYGLCAVVGPYKSNSAEGVSVVTAAMDVPLVTHHAEAARIGRPAFYPLTARANVDEYSRSDALVSYLTRHRGRDYVALIYTTSNADVRKVMAASAKTFGLHFMAQPISPPFTHDGVNSVPDAMRRIKAAGYRTIVVAVVRLNQMAFIWRYAEEYGMNEAGGYLWLSYDTSNLEGLTGEFRVAPPGGRRPNMDGNDGKNGGEDGDDGDGLKGNMMQPPRPPPPKRLPDVDHDLLRRKLLRGMGMVVPLDSFAYQGQEDPFLQAWKRQGPAEVQRLNELNPVARGEAGYLDASGEDYFQTNDPPRYSGYIYDTVIALGMGACRSRSGSGGEASGSGAESSGGKVGKSVGGGGRTRKRSDGDVAAMATETETAAEMETEMATIAAAGGTPSTRSLRRGSLRRRLQGGPPANLKKTGTNNAFYNELVKVEFTGATGKVILHDDYHYTRDPRSIAYGMYNIQEVRDNSGQQELDENGTKDAAKNNTTSNEKTKKVRFEYVLTAVRHPWEEEWTDVLGQPYVYSDGTTSEPMPLRTCAENNYLSTWVRAVGLTLMSLFLVAGLAAMGWVYRMQNTRIVKASQPEFLGLLCCGSVVMSLSIVTLSFDEGVGSRWDEEALSRACMATPWLFVLGYLIIYTALFTKLWRVNKTLQFRRKKVSIRNVIGPMMGLMFAAVVVLTAWTIVDPWVWRRTVIDEGTGETYGYCDADNKIAFFVPLLVLMLLATLLAAFMAYKTKDISNKYTETDWIFYAIFVQIQTWAVGVPVLFILRNGSVDATYLGSVMVIWTFATSMVALIIGPKVLASRQGEGSGVMHNRRKRGSLAKGSVTGFSESSLLAMPSTSRFSTRLGSSSSIVGLGRRRSSVGLKHGNSNGSMQHAHSGRDVRGVCTCPCTCNGRKGNGGCLNETALNVDVGVDNAIPAVELFNPTSSSGKPSSQPRSQQSDDAKARNNLDHNDLVPRGGDVCMDKPNSCKAFTNGASQDTTSTSTSANAPASARPNSDKAHDTSPEADSTPITDSIPQSSHQIDDDHPDISPHDVISPTSNSAESCNSTSNEAEASPISPTWNTPTGKHTEDHSEDLLDEEHFEPFVRLESYGGSILGIPRDKEQAGMPATAAQSVEDHQAQGSDSCLQPGQEGTAFATIDFTESKKVSRTDAPDVVVVNEGLVLGSPSSKEGQDEEHSSPILSDEIKTP